MDNLQESKPSEIEEEENIEQISSDINTIAETLVITEDQVITNEGVNTTYKLSTSQGNASGVVNLTDSDEGTSSVTFKGAGGINVTSSTNNTVTISGTEKNIDYNLKASPGQGNAVLKLNECTNEVSSVVFQGTGSTTVTSDDGKIIIGNSGSATDTNTTYSLGATQGNGSVSLQLTGSDKTTSNITLTGTGGTSLNVDNNNITISSPTSVSSDGSGDTTSSDMYRLDSESVEGGKAANIILKNNNTVTDRLQLKSEQGLSIRSMRDEDPYSKAIVLNADIPEIPEIPDPSFHLSTGPALVFDKGNGEATTIFFEGTDGVSVSANYGSDRKVITISGSGSTGSEPSSPSSGSYTLPAATATALGGIKIGYPIEIPGRFPVELDSDTHQDQAFVHSPVDSFLISNGTNGVKLGLHDEGGAIVDSLYEKRTIDITATNGIKVNNNEGKAINISIKGTSKWTPKLTGKNTSGIVETFSTDGLHDNSGSYYQIGELIFFRILITVKSGGGATKDGIVYCSLPIPISTSSDIPVKGIAVWDHYGANTSTFLIKTPKCDAMSNQLPLPSQPVSNTTIDIAGFYVTT